MIGQNLARALVPPPSVIVRPKGLNYDSMLVPNQMGGWYGNVHRGTFGFSYDQLDQIARKPILGDPIRVRQAQVAARCRPSDSEDKPGWWIRPIDKQATITPAMQSKIREIQAAILNAGGPFQMPPNGAGRGNMVQSMRMFLHDSLRYDQAVFEVLRTYSGRIVGWLPQDARYFRLRNVTAEELESRQRLGTDAGAPFRQINAAGSAVRDFDAEELCWFIRRPRTDERFLGYGWPEYDEGCEVGSAVLKTWKSNDVKFDNGIHSAVLVLVRSMMSNDNDAFDDFKRNMMGLLSGVQNTGRAVIAGVQPGMWQGVQAEDIEIKPIGPSNQEMEFDKWLHMGIRGVCNLWNMDAAEIGFTYGNEGQSSALGSAGPGEKITASQALGLWPLLDDIASAFNASMVWQIDPEFLMEFTGRGDPSEQYRQTIELAAASVYMTPNELRKRRGLAPLPFPEADAPISLAQYLSPQAVAGNDYTLGGGIRSAPLPAGVTLPGPRTGPLDGAMKGCDPRDVERWTERYTMALHNERRVQLVDKGAGAKAWRVDIGK